MVNVQRASVAKCRGSWVVGRGRGSWVWVWVNVVGKKSMEKNDKKIIIIINRKNCKTFIKRKSPTP